MKLYNFSGSVWSKRDPKKRSWREKHSLFGVGAFICPSCYKVILAKCNLTREVCILDENLDDDGYVYIDDFRIGCPFCNHRFTHHGNPIDPNIAYPLAILNSKGYHTMYSCEGHSLNDDAYVVFSDFSQKSIVKENPLPNDWFMDNTDLLDDENKMQSRFIIRSYRGIKLKRRIEGLTYWAISLPNWVEPVKNENKKASWLKRIFSRR